MEVYKTNKTKTEKSKPQNTLMALNDKLFEQLEILSSSDLKGGELREEVARVDSMLDVGKLIIANANTCLEAARIVKKDDGFIEIPKMIDG